VELCCKPIPRPLLLFVWSLTGALSSAILSYMKASLSITGEHSAFSKLLLAILWSEVGYVQPNNAWMVLQY
jgi:hypothetical protein